MFGICWVFFILVLGSVVLGFLLSVGFCCVDVG